MNKTKNSLKDEYVVMNSDFEMQYIFDNKKDALDKCEEENLRLEISLYQVDNLESAIKKLSDKIYNQAYYNGQDDNNGIQGDD